MVLKENLLLKEMPHKKAMQLLTWSLRQISYSVRDVNENKVNCIVSIYYLQKWFGIKTEAFYVEQWKRPKHCKC